MRYLIVLLMCVEPLCAVGGKERADSRQEVIDVPEFDAAQTLAEGRLRITPTDRRDHDRPPLKLKLPTTGGMPAGTKLVRLFFNDASQSWCAVVTHPNYLKVSPAGVVPVMTLILKVGE